MLKNADNAFRQSIDIEIQSFLELSNIIYYIPENSDRSLWKSLLFLLILLWHDSIDLLLYTYVSTLQLQSQHQKIPKDFRSPSKEHKFKTPSPRCATPEEAENVRNIDWNAAYEGITRRRKKFSKVINGVSIDNYRYSRTKLMIPRTRQKRYIRETFSIPTKEPGKDYNPTQSQHQLNN